MSTLNARLTPLLERRLSPSLHKRCVHILLINADPPGDVSTALQLAHRLFRDDETFANRHENRASHDREQPQEPAEDPGRHTAQEIKNNPELLRLYRKNLYSLIGAPFDFHHLGNGAPRKVTKTRPGITKDAQLIFKVEVWGGHDPTCPGCHRPQVFLATPHGTVHGMRKYEVFRLCPMQAVRVCPLTKERIRFYQCAPPESPDFPRLKFNSTIFYAMTIIVNNGTNIECSYG